MLIALIGKPNSGKSTLLNKLANDSYLTFNMDNFVHDIYKVNKIGYLLIKSNFGNKYVNNTMVDRKKLKQKIKENMQNYIKLNNLIFPIIRQKILELKSQHINNLLIIEFPIYLISPKYFENLFDQLILIENNFSKDNIDYYWEKIYNQNKSLKINFNLVIKNIQIEATYKLLVSYLNELKNKK